MRAIAGNKLLLLVFLVMTGCASIVYTVIDFDRLYAPLPTQITRVNARGAPTT